MEMMVPQRLLFSNYQGDILIELRKGTFLSSLHIFVV
jgi:hypothetical protein